jgi:hypothetical protein
MAHHRRVRSHRLSSSRRTILTGAALWLPILGCSERPAHTGATAHRDSAGVTLVDNAGAAWSDASRWRVDPDPRLDIGTVEGDAAYELFNALSALRLDDGRIVVANGGTQELRLYDPDGNHLHTSGRTGEGPGEFTGLDWVRRWRRDSLVTWDYRLRRASIFDRDGAFAWSVRIGESEELSQPEIVGRSGDTAFVARSRTILQHGSEPGVNRPSLRYDLIDTTGRPIGSIGRFPGTESYMRVRDGGMMMSALLFGKRTTAIARGGLLWVGTADAYEISAYTMAGTLVRRIRKRHDNLTIRDEDLSARRAQQLSEFANDMMRRHFEQLYLEMPTPSTMPAYERFLFDLSGNLWVEEYRRPGDAVPVFSVFDGDGRRLGAVRMPAGVTVLEVGEDYVLGHWRDDLDVEHIRLLNLTKPS